MKLKCIKSIRYLTVGNYYEVNPSEKNQDSFWVWKDDLYQGGWYHKDLFQTIEDNRDEKINDITNDI
jgi:hypothetical protein